VKTDDGAGCLKSGVGQGTEDGRPGQDGGPGSRVTMKTRKGGFIFGLTLIFYTFAAAGFGRTLSSAG
jgi:hypothetical protein